MRSKQWGRACPTGPRALGSKVAVLQLNWWQVRIFISAGEASGDLYASRLVEVLKARYPDAEFFGCAGPRMQAAGVRAIVDARSLSVVGIVEVIAHIPRIYGEFRKLVRAAKMERPALAILT